MRLAACLTAALLATSVLAKLPPATDADKAKGAEAAAKAAWTEKSNLYKLCVVQDKIAGAYRNSAKSAGKNVPAALPTPQCTDPGPYVSAVTPLASKPLEASGAHSPSWNRTRGSVESRVARRS